MGGVTPAIGQVLLENYFTWFPDWLVLDFSMEMFAQLPPPTLIALMVLAFVSAVTIGGLWQELYFRGYLLPRMAWLGNRAPILNAALFAVFHLTSPWNWPGFFLMVLPWSFVAQKKRSMYLGIFAHSGMLLLSWVMMSLMIFSAL